MSVILFNVFVYGFGCFVCELINFIWVVFFDCIFVILVIVKMGRKWGFGIEMDWLVE